VSSFPRQSSPAVQDDPRPLCSLSVDLDGLAHYARIYGFSSPLAGDQVYARGLPRLLDLCAELGLPATLFAIGADLADPGHAAALAAATACGHEVASHSQAHDYALTRLPAAAQAADLDAAAQAIARATGRPPLGFRAPGYTVSPRLLALLAERGYVYDSSVLASPPYYLLKAAALTVLGLTGRRSASILGDPLVMTAPAVPYLPGGHGYRHRRGGEPAAAPLELPIAVLPGLRLPLFGQTLFLLGSSALAALVPRLARTRPHLVLELHGIDALGVAEDGLPPQLLVQPDLRLALVDKLRILREVLLALGRSYRFVTLAEAAEVWGSYTPDHRSATGTNVQGITMPPLVLDRDLDLDLAGGGAVQVQVQRF